MKYLILFVFLVGCAGAPFKKGFKVQSEGTFLKKTFTQNNSELTELDLMAGLKDYRKTHATANASQKWLYGATGFFAVGASLLLYNVIRMSGEGTTDGMLIGVSLLGAATGAKYASDLEAQEALNIYHKNYAK